MIKFDEETNIFVQYNEEFWYESFDCQKWRGREILFDKTKSSLKTTFVKTKVRCKAFCDALNVCLSGYEYFY